MPDSDEKGSLFEPISEDQFRRELLTAQDAYRCGDYMDALKFCEDVSQTGHGKDLVAIISAHEFCRNNMPALEKDSKCGCFYCLKIFDPSEITDYVQDTEGSAICPYCGIDSVIGESSGYPITREFLQAMKKHWF